MFFIVCTLFMHLLLSDLFCKPLYLTVIELFDLQLAIVLFVNPLFVLLHLY